MILSCLFSDIAVVLRAMIARYVNPWTIPQISGRFFPCTEALEDMQRCIKSLLSKPRHYLSALAASEPIMGGIDCRPKRVRGYFPLGGPLLQSGSFQSRGPFFPKQRALPQSCNIHSCCTSLTHIHTHSHSLGRKQDSVLWLVLSWLLFSVPEGSICPGCPRRPRFVWMMRSAFSTQLDQGLKSRGPVQKKGVTSSIVL